MGKKDPTPKAAAPIKRAAKPGIKPAPAAEAAPNTAGMVEKPKGTSKPAVRKKSAGNGSAPAAAKGQGFTADDIALRAYFISEERRAKGMSGNEQQDWIEAERQLQAEFSRKPRSRPA